MRELRLNSGTQFDPVVAEAFLRLLGNDSIARRPELPSAMPTPTWRADRTLLSE